jgi:hypothetical protein
VEKGIVSPASHFEPIHEQCIVEAFPNLFLAALVPEDRIPVLRRDASDRYWEILVHQTSRLEETLAALLPGRVLSTTLQTCRNHEHRAALVCALTALSVRAGQYVGVGDPSDGDIMLPPSTLWGASAAGSGAWMARALSFNLAAVRADRKAHAHHGRARIHENHRSWQTNPCETLSNRE